MVVACGAVAASYEDALCAALGGAQEALDSWSLVGVDDLAITGVSEDHLVWWPTVAGLVVRVVSMSTMGFRLRGQGTVTSGGDLVSEGGPDAFAWHPSFRYFRLSQATDDLVDAFRYAFLALESILSSIAPPVVNQHGGKEGEANWFKRAIGEAGKRVDLANFASTGAGDLAERVFRDLYPARTAAFHAKVGRSVLPLDPAARTQLAATLLRSVRLYLAVAETHLGVRRPRSSLSEFAFRTSSSVFSDVAVWVSEDESPFDSADATVNPSGMAAIELPGMHEADDSVPFQWTRMASASAGDLASLAHIRRIVAASPTGTPMLTQVLEERLILGSAGRLEVVFGVRHRNEGPRLDYLT